jgi:hypothetical protein
MHIDDDSEVEYFVEIIKSWDNLLWNFFEYESLFIKYIK